MPAKKEEQQLQLAPTLPGIHLLRTIQYTRVKGAQTPRPKEEAHTNIWKGRETQHDREASANCDKGDEVRCTVGLR